MTEDPYEGLLGIMQSEGAKFNPPSFCLGEVVSVSPLNIKVDELILYPDDFLIADYLLEGYKRSLKVSSKGTITNNGKSSMNGTLLSSTQNTSGGSGDDSFASHNHTINDQATLNGTCEASGQYTLEGESEVEYEGYLKKGDILALMPMDGEQLYVVLCKAVSIE
ncbi:DUF2577 domain-containing protein [Niameybacter massiliensis]|uniref:DUF2577 domain-containing protein n=1 Tax=Niameybacter massiliensis TaxID=1658108 RepID=UPI0006B65521|nr:DUF2577 domain-containing protein [Niameybacter massiliensis]